jgi:hypothetical protein
MARRTRIYIVETDDPDNRDKGKRFFITEKYSDDAEWWATRCLLAILGSNQEAPDLENLSLAKLAEVGLRGLAGLTPEHAKPLLDEMFECIQFMPDPNRKDYTRELKREDIEEVSTRLALRGEVFDLHTGFLKAAGPLISRFQEVVKAALVKGLDTPTSPASSEP